MQLALYALPVAFLLLLALEQAFPLRKPNRPLLRRLVVNGCVAALALTAAAILVRPVASALLGRAPELGLMSMVAMPQSARWIIGFLLLDISFYYWHRANHVSRFLWRFHNAHHIDPDLDVSTAYRFHFGEITLSSAFNVIQVSLIGISPWAFAIYQLAFQAEVVFHHSNLRSPIGFERLLSKMIVTP